VTLLEWKTEYSLGIAEVDLEHREMIGLINECYERLGVARDPLAIEQFLGEIYAGVASHFALEEQIMRRAAYPDYEAHKADHEELLDEIRDLMDAFLDDPDGGAQQLRERLGDWFGNHFRTFDARLHHHVPQQQA
jgi:hemerythrin